MNANFPNFPVAPPPAVGKSSTFKSSVCRLNDLWGASDNWMDDDKCNASTYSTCTFSCLMLRPVLLICLENCGCRPTPSERNCSTANGIGQLWRRSYPHVLHTKPMTIVMWYPLPCLATRIFLYTDVQFAFRYLLQIHHKLCRLPPSSGFRKFLGSRWCKCRRG